jgi:2-methylisocitrate lyase-like PEP mutase family enzyme
MLSQAAKQQRFETLHRGDKPLLLPNPWDVGSARMLESLGFDALATTSSGFAGSLGRLDGHVTRDDALAHARAIAGATDLPVSADLEHGFADEPAAVAETLTLAAGTGLAGCSIEDWSGGDAAQLYDAALAAERIAAAADAAHGGPARLVLTARAENYVRGRPDLADTIARLQSFQAAGADVLYAPGMTDLGDIGRLVAAVDRPVNVLLRPGGPTVSELAAVGVKRISFGGALSLVAIGAASAAAREVLEHGTHSFWALATAGRAVVAQAFD